MKVTSITSAQCISYVSVSPQTRCAVSLSMKPRSLLKFCGCARACTSFFDPRFSEHYYLHTSLHLKLTIYTYFFELGILTWLHFVPCILTLNCSGCYIFRLYPFASALLNAIWMHFRLRPSKLTMRTKKETLFRSMKRKLRRE